MAGSSPMETLVANSANEQVSVFTLGQCLLGGAAICLQVFGAEWSYGTRGVQMSPHSSWLSLRGGSFTVNCGDSGYRFGSTLVAEPELVDESFSAIGPFDGAEEIEHDESPNEEGKEGFLNELTKVSNNKTRWWQLKYFWNFHPKNCGR